MIQSNWRPLSWERVPFEVSVSSSNPSGAEVDTTFRVVCNGHLTGFACLPGRVAVNVCYLHRGAPPLRPPGLCQGRGTRVYIRDEERGSISGTRNAGLYQGRGTWVYIRDEERWSISGTRNAGQGRGTRVSIRDEERGSISGTRNAVQYQGRGTRVYPWAGAAKTLSSPCSMIPLTG